MITEKTKQAMARREKMKKPQIKLHAKRVGKMPSWLQEEIGGSKNPSMEVAAAQIAKRIVRSYGGQERLRRLLQLFEDGVFIEKIGEEFNVTKQRVSQWRKALGAVEEKFTPRPIVQRVLSKGI